MDRTVTDTGRFEDATPRMLRKLLSVIDQLPPGAIRWLTNWAARGYVFPSGNQDGINYYVMMGKKDRK